MECEVCVGKMRLECEVCVGKMRSEPVSEIKYLRCVLDESSTNEGEWWRKVASGKRVNTRDLHLVCARVLLD